MTPFVNYIATWGKNRKKNSRELESFERGLDVCWQVLAPLNDTRHNLQFGNARCSGHAKPQFNYCTRANWLAGSAVTRNAVQIDLGGSQFATLGLALYMG